MWATVLKPHVRHEGRHHLGGLFEHKGTVFGLKGGDNKLG